MKRKIHYMRLMRKMLSGNITQKGASRTKVITSQGLMISLVIIATILVTTVTPSLLFAQKTFGTKTTQSNISYAMMGPSNEIAVLNMDTRKIVGSISVDGNPHGGALTPDGNYIYTSSMGSKWISVVDTRTREVISRIDAGSISHHATVRPDGRYVYVAAAQLVVIDTATNKIVTRIVTPEAPFYPAFSPDGRRLYVLSMGSTISVIDTETNKHTDTFEMESKTMMGHLAVSPDGKTLYATNDMAGTLSILDARNGELRASVSVGKQPHGVAVSADGKRVFVSNRGETIISVVDSETAKVMQKITLGGYPEHLTMAYNGDYLFAGLRDRFQSKESNRKSSRDMTAAVAIIDPYTLEVVGEIPAWPQVHAILVSKTVEQP